MQLVIPQIIALVTKSKGDVKYKKNQSSSDTKLAMGTPLFSNDLIKTGGDGLQYLYILMIKYDKVQKNSEIMLR